ncbi:MAG: hypothetical protein QOE35_590 [Actinomycetota bacterium]|jgi:hypothetical protein
MTGECVLATVGHQDVAGPLPTGIAPLPGPAVLVAERHVDSPAGPFATFVLGRPARIGLRGGICFTTAAVSSSDSRMAGRHHWGFPGEIATLRWDAGVDEHVIRWEERGIVVRARFGRRGVPLVVPFRAVQHRVDGPVVVRGRLRGRARRGRLTIEVEGPGAAVLTGSHRAVHIAGLRLVLEPARAPRGYLGTLLAPAPGIEPGYGFVSGRASFSRTASRPSRAPVG